MRLSPRSILGTIFAIVLAIAFAGELLAHGDVQPQPVDTTGLDSLGKDWRAENPYRTGDKKVMMLAIEIGSGAYNQNCARCHGLQGMSGGLAPDLRFLEEDADGDDWFVQRVRNGFHQNGVTKMPAYQDLLSQEALWCIRTYVDSLPED
jgi:cytochrome c-550 PedF